MPTAAPTAPPRIFSPARRAASFQRAVARQKRGNAADHLLLHMGEDVKERLSFMQFQPPTAIVIGDPAGILAEELRRWGTQVTPVPAGVWHGDEPLTTPAADLVLCDSSLATINDLPGALLHLRQMLLPGGLLIASIIGAGSVPRLRSAMLAAEPDRPHPRIHPQIDNRTASALLQRTGFARQVVDTNTLTVRYAQLSSLVSDLRDQGLGSVLASPPPALSRTAYRRTQEAFAALADADGRVSERFEFVTLTAWRD